MPIYCYKCYDCDHYEEIKQKISDEPLTKCTQCGGRFRRVIRNVGVIFKGSGFHVTDYTRSKVAAPGQAKKEEKKKEKTEKKEESSFETAESKDKS